MVGMSTPQKDEFLKPFDVKPKSGEEPTIPKIKSDNIIFQPPPPIITSTDEDLPKSQSGSISNGSINLQLPSSKSSSLSLAPPATIQGSNLSLVSGKKSKVSVGSGYSMLDWMRKEGTRTDFVPDLKREIGLDELAKHDHLGDLWMALGGKVYDLTDYANYHPGGIEELMKGAGIDGTTEFTNAHSFVNWEPILKYRQIGILVRRDTLGSGGSSDLTCQSKHVMGCIGLCGILKGNKNNELVSCLNFTEDDKNVYLQFASKPLRISKRMSEDNWSASILEREKFILKLYLKPPEIWMSHVKLLHKLQNSRINLTYQNDCKNLLVSLEKPEEKIKWKSLGSSLVDNGKLYKTQNNGIIDDMNLAQLHSIERLTHDTNLYTFELAPSCHLGVPIGYHFKMRINGITRKITPICTSLDRRLTKEEIVENGQMIYCIIKIYSRGIFTQQLDKLNLGDQIWMGSTLGTFDTSWIEQPNTNLVFLAAGTGITPMIRIIRHSLSESEKKKPEEEKSSAILIFFNKTEEDVIWEGNWKRLASRTPYFHFFSVLSRPSSNWSGFTGRVSSSTLMGILRGVSPGFDGENEKKHTVRHKFLVCGSNGFNKEAKRSILQASTLFKDDSIFIFEG